MFDSNLRRLMANHKIDSDTELARLVGISRITVRRIKNNEIQQIDLDVASKLCSFFNCTLDVLWVYIPAKN